MGCNSSTATAANTTASTDATENGSAPTERLGNALIVGATGQQGGAVVRAMAKDASFKLFGLTRNPDSDKATAIAKSHPVTMLKGELSDKAALVTHIKDNTIEYIFLVTQFWEHCDAEKEISDGKAVIDAAKEAGGVKHFIFSGFEDPKERGVPECEPISTKAEIGKHLTASEIPYTIVACPFYMENFMHMAKPRKVNENEYVLDLAMEGKTMALISVADFGECVKSAFKNGDKSKGVSKGLAGDKLKVEEMANIFTKHISGKTFKDGQLTLAAMASTPQPGAPLMAKVFKYFQTEPERDVELTRKLCPAAKTFDQWVEANKEDLAKAIDGETPEPKSTAISVNA